MLKAAAKASEIQVLWNGKTKDLLPSGQPGLVIQQFTEGTKRRTLPKISKAVLANEVSAYLFTYLKGYRIPTHFVEKVSESAMLVRQLEMIPLTVKVWNVATKDFSRQFGLREFSELAVPVIEHYHGAPGKTPQLVNEFHIYALGITTPEHLRSINRLASKANIVLRSFFARRELRLVSVQLTFGLMNGQVVIGDELSPFTCSVIDSRKPKRGVSPLVTANGASTIGACVEFRNRVCGSA